MAKKAYRVRNWKDYNKSLVQRGSLTFWLSEDLIKQWATPEIKSTARGRPQKYPDGLILAALTLRQLYRIPLRTTEGFIRSVIELMKLPLETPNYTTFSIRGRNLSVPLCIPNQKESRHVLVDSTGIQIIGEGEWKTMLHGRSKHQVWRKLHLAVDAENHTILAMEMTESVRLDGNYLLPLVDKIDCQIKQIIGDGAYDKKSCYQAAYKRGAKAVFPPQHDAIIQRNKIKKNPALMQRDETIIFIGNGPDKEDRLKQWKKINGYHRRSLIETMMSRMKSIFGDQMRSRCYENQKTDLAIRCRIINKMNLLGMPTSIAINNI